MAKKWGLLLGLLTVGMVPCVVPPLRAQGPGFNPSARPTFSPWLNLNRRGTSSAVNYFGIIRPQVNFSNSIQQLQQETAAIEQQQATTAGSELPATGHVAGFLNHNKYFMNRGGATAAGDRFVPNPSASVQRPPVRRGR
ncbi:MAG: hypothetical protein L0Y71_10755 [Gemmataceae bacterium]|nr:hypothetical protein [Gemmataceae bacterium]